MDAAKGIFGKGKVTFFTPPAWPDGVEVRVEMSGYDMDVGIRAKDWPTDPVGIAELLRMIDAIQPWLSIEDEAAWKQALAEQKAWELAHWDEYCRKIEKLFE